MRSWSGLLTVGLLAIGSLWYFGRGIPIERTTVPYTTWTTCPECCGKGRVTCPECRGFGSVEVKVRCPDCGGSGKHRWHFRGSHVSAPCQTCRGTGYILARRKCERCDGKGWVSCPRCDGCGRVRIVRYRPSVRMGLSLWERVLSFLRLPVAANPPPARSRTGTYALLERYLSLYGGDGRVKLTECSDFSFQNGAWHATGRVSVARSGGRVATYDAHFVVRDRCLTACRRVVRVR